MKRYDPNEKCPKCGNDCVSTSFSSGLMSPFYKKLVEDSIKRECGRCGFVWYEATLDSPEKPEER